MCRRWATVEQASRAVDQRTGADAGQQGSAVAESTQPGQVCLVGHQRAGTLTAWIDEDIDGLCLGNRQMHSELQALSSHDGPAIHGHAHDPVAAVGSQGSPRCEDLPRPDGIQLLDTVEQQDRDDLTPVSVMVRVARTVIVSGDGSRLLELSQRRAGLSGQPWVIGQLGFVITDGRLIDDMHGPLLRAEVFDIVGVDGNGLRRFV